MRRVLYVSALPPPGGGICTWTRILFERGLPDGYSPLLVDTRLPERRRVFERGGASVSQAWRTLRILGTLLFELIRSRPVLVHFNVDALGLGLLRDSIGACMARAFRVPVVLHYHGLVSEIGDGPERRCQRWLLARAIRLAALDLVMNQPSLAYVRSLAGDAGARVVLLPNFFDETELPRAELAPRAPEATPRVVFVGGLTRAKGALEVLAVARELPEVEFQMLGAVYDEVRDEVDAAPSNVRVRGEVEHDEVVQELARSHLLLFPTAHPEGFPYAVLEAMAMGLPVVSTWVGAIPEMVEEGRGGVLAERTTSDLVRAVREVLSDETRRLEMGRFNRDKSYEQYAYGRVIERVAQHYGRVARR